MPTVYFGQKNQDRRPGTILPEIHPLCTFTVCFHHKPLREFRAARFTTYVIALFSSGGLNRGESRISKKDHLPIITVRNEVAKVMFIHLSVCPQGGLPQCMLGYHQHHPPPPPEQTPKRRPPAPADGYYCRLISGVPGGFWAFHTFFWPAEFPGYHQWQQESQ